MKHSFNRAKAALNEKKKKKKKRPWDFFKVNKAYMEENHRQT